MTIHKVVETFKNAKLNLINEVLKPFLRFPLTLFIFITPGESEMGLYKSYRFFKYFGSFL